MRAALLESWLCARGWKRLERSMHSFWSRFSYSVWWTLLHCNSFSLGKKNLLNFSIRTQNHRKRAKKKAKTPAPGSLSGSPTIHGTNLRLPKKSLQISNFSCSICILVEEKYILTLSILCIWNHYLTIVTNPMPWPGQSYRCLFWLCKTSPRAHSPGKGHQLGQGHEK